jgi:hypothetical protein
VSLLAIAFKEWAGVCAALATGQQHIILRKGGIAESGGEFRCKHDSFWLYPTFFHEPEGGLKPGITAPLRPAEGTIVLTHFAMVNRIEWMANLDDVMALDSQHVWTAAAIQKRFNYRTPGLYCLHVEVRPAQHPHQIAESPEYAGCKTWVPLASPLETGHA